MEFSMKEIIALLIKRFMFIIICTFGGMCIFFAANHYVIKPSYTASVQLYVNANDTTTVADLNELNYAQKVVSTYINFLQTKVFYTQVISQSGLDYSYVQLKSMTKIQSVDNTEIFQISVTTYSADDSYQLVSAMQEIAPILIRSIKSNAEISVVDPVYKPYSPSGPNIMINTLVGGLLGFITAVLTSFLWEVIDVNVKNEEELLTKYKKPILGSIPDYNFSKRRKYLLHKFIPFLRKRKIKNGKKNIKEEAKYMVNEAYNSLRTNLRFTLRKDGCKKIIINSPLPEDGKSTTSVNIAITISQTGAKVLLLDCDLRKGTLHTYFGLRCVPGMSDTISGMVSEKDAIQDTPYDNLQIITMGAVPPNPSELLGSYQMEDLIKKLEKVYDYIIIDSPPINVVSDVLSLVKLTDGVVIVIREGITPHPSIHSAIEKYNFSGANLLGFVMNAISINNAGNSKSKYYYYYKYKKKNG